MSNIFRNSIQIYALKSPTINKSQHRDSIKKQYIEKSQFPPILSVRRSSLQNYLSAKKIKQQQKIKQKTITQKILDLSKKKQLSTLDVNQDIGNHKIYYQDIYHLTEQQRQLLTSKQIRKSYQRQSQKRSLKLSNASQIISKMRKFHQRHKRQLNQLKNMRYNGCQQMMRYSECQQKVYKDEIQYLNQKSYQKQVNENVKKVFNTIEKQKDSLLIRNKKFTQKQNQNFIQSKNNQQFTQQQKNQQKKLIIQNRSQSTNNKQFLQQQTIKNQNQLQSSLIDSESQKFHFDPNDKEISNLLKKRRKIKEEKIINKKFKYRSLSSVDNLPNHNFLTKKTTLSKDSQSYDNLFEEQEQYLLRKTKHQNKNNQSQKVKSQKLAQIVQKKLKRNTQKTSKQPWNEGCQPWKQEGNILISKKYTDDQFSIQKYSQNQNRKYSEHLLS